MDDHNMLIFGDLFAKDYPYYCSVRHVYSRIKALIFSVQQSRFLLLKKRLNICLAELCVCLRALHM